eukprot:1469511-Amphidinium_carterae.1
MVREAVGMWQDGDTGLLRVRIRAVRDGAIGFATVAADAHQKPKKIVKASWFLVNPVWFMA